MIEVNNLVKRYGDHTAVDHLSFKIEKGKIYGFLGPNGAGKSTTMNMITGYIASTEGTVTIDGHDILDEPEQAKKCIGYLPEMPPLYFDMTVGEYMNFVADLKKIPKDQKKSMVEEVMEMVKITDMKNRLIKNLSKGYRQRVGLAQAILGYPEVIILDSGYHFTKGPNQVNGDQALAFCRERYAFSAGDRQRGKDQMKVIQGVINKATSPDILKNYLSLLDSLSGCFETNIPYDVITSLVKQQLDEGGSWQVLSYSVDGTGDTQKPYSMSQKAYVMVPDQTTVDKAKTLMQKVRQGFMLSEADVSAQ